VLLLTHLPALLPRSTIQDESVYVVFGRQVLQGARAYVDVVDRKPPLLFWLYREVLGTFGTSNWLALQLVGVLWVLLTMAGLALVGELVGGLWVGLIAALLYPIFQGFWEITNLAFNGEVMMNLLGVQGLALVLRPPRSRIRPELLIAGPLPAVGFLLKQPAAISGVAYAVYLLHPEYLARHGLRRRDGLLQALWLLVGFVATLGAAAPLLQQQGILREAFYWSVQAHDLTYGPLSPVFWQRCARTTLIFFLCCAPLLYGTGRSLRRPDLWLGRSPERRGLLTFLVVTVIGTAASGRFFDYYYIQLLPPLCLLAAPWLAEAWRPGAEGLLYERLP